MTQGIYDQSYPPSLWQTPPVGPATGATAGIPGTWTPPGATPPADAAGAAATGVVASPATAWTSGQYVQGTTVGAAGRMTWTGTQWVGGAAPLTAAALAALTVAGVQEFVRANPELLAETYAAEQVGSGRVTLLAWLKTLLDEEAAGQEPLWDA